MTTDANGAHPRAGIGVPSTSDDMLAAVYTRLARIHGSMAEATSDDPEILGWSLHEIMGVLREIRAFRQEQIGEPAASTSAPR